MCAAATAPRAWTEPWRGADHSTLLYDEKGLQQLIIDASALVALLRAEVDAPAFCARAPLRAPSPSASQQRISFETAIVIDGSRDPIASRRLDELIFKAGIEIEPVTAEDGANRPSRLSRFWQGRPPRRIEFRGLLRLRPGESKE